MTEYKEIKKRFFYEGVELSSFLAKFPLNAEWTAISEFYEQLALNAYGWFCDVFCEKCKEEYEADTDPQKRFGRNVYRYNLNFFATELGNGHLKVDCDAVLKKGKNETVSVFRESHLWNRETQLLVKDKKAEKKK